MVRSKVDLPQPDGPTMAINSPRFGKSSIVKVTSLIAIFASGPEPKVLVTFLNATTSGRGAGALASASGEPDGSFSSAAPSGSGLGVLSASDMATPRSCDTE